MRTKTDHETVNAAASTYAASATTRILALLELGTYDVQESIAACVALSEPGTLEFYCARCFGYVCSDHVH